MANRRCCCTEEASPCGVCTGDSTPLQLELTVPAGAFTFSDPAPEAYPDCDQTDCDAADETTYTLDQCPSDACLYSAPFNLDCGATLFWVFDLDLGVLYAGENDCATSGNCDMGAGLDATWPLSMDCSTMDENFTADTGGGLDCVPCDPNGTSGWRIRAL